MSDYFRQNANTCEFKLSDIWTLLLPIEKSIKEKIDKVGVPLRDWDIKINYGVKTGFNDAFIITGEKKNELISIEPKSAEIIRPILRGRDVKRYGYDFTDFWLIDAHNGIKEKAVKPINIEDYPAIKKHLDQYYFKLAKRADKGVTPYNLRNCAYTEDFSKPKMLWAETMRIHKNSKERFPRFSYDPKGEYMTDKTCFFATGENIKYVLCILNSKMGRYLCSKYVSILDDGGYLMQKIYIEQIPLVKPSSADQDNLISLIDKILNAGGSEELEDKIDKIIFNLYQMDQKEINFIQNSFKLN